MARGYTSTTTVVNGIIDTKIALDAILKNCASESWSKTWDFVKNEVKDFEITDDELIFIQNNFQIYATKFQVHMFAGRENNKDSWT